jgi:hypothetical protein
MLNFTKDSTASLMDETGFQSVKLKLHSYLSPDHLKRKETQSQIGFNMAP